METKLTNNEVHEVIAAQLLKFRKKYGLSQLKVGDILNISNQQYSKLEKGQNRIFAAQLFLIAQEYSINIDKFYSDVDF